MELGICLLRMGDGAWSLVMLWKITAVSENIKTQNKAIKDCLGPGRQSCRRIVYASSIVCWTSYKGGQPMGGAIGNL